MTAGRSSGRERLCEGSRGRGRACSCAKAAPRRRGAHAKRCARAAQSEILVYLSFLHENLLLLRSIGSVPGCIVWAQRGIVSHRAHGHGHSRAARVQRVRVSLCWCGGSGRGQD